MKPIFISHNSEKATEEGINYIEFGTCKTEENGNGNIYLLDLPAEGDKSITIFSGFTEEKQLAAQLQAMRASSAEFKIAIVNDRQLDSHEMKDFLAEEGGGVCRISKPGIDYYTSVLDKMIGSTGFAAPDIGERRYIVFSLKQIYGHRFSEVHILAACKQAIIRACDRKQTQLTVADFLGRDKDEPVEERLKEMVGLKGIKELIPEFKGLLLASVDNPKLVGFHRHMIFTGNPGTGKTMSARLVADLLKEIGVGNGVFIEADRTSLIGKYVGHTAPKVRDKFEAARGGILFVDEAGFFLTDTEHGRNYTSEALKEFVRYMENYPDVIVIFAMYDREMEGFLKLDEGLRSRISRKIHFDDYDADELFSITEGFFRQYDYSSDEAAKEKIKSYIADNLENFGNGRGARNLAETLIRVACADDPHGRRIKASYLEPATERLKGTTSVVKRKSFGFSTEG